MNQPIESIIEQIKFAFIIMKSIFVLWWLPSSIAYPPRVR